MENGFSGVVRLSNVSDFIAPAPACILPYRKSEKVEDKGDGKVGVHRKGEQKPLKKVTISLNDCLACSGCITSAETVLVQEQSLPKLLDGLSRSDFAVVTVCPQSLCSIAAKRGVSVGHAARLLSGVLKRLGARYVLDSSFGRYFALQMTYEEFRDRRDKTFLLSSACPGFVCFAEKKYGDLLIPHISRVRSPQAIMGSIVKDYLARSLSVPSERIFHASVMPCFDKKLEASRADFADEACKVDCVISTGEADELIGDEVSESEEDDEAGCSDWLTAIEHGTVIGGRGGASGGYAEYVVECFIRDSDNDALTVRRTVVTNNLEKIEVVDGESVLLTVAKCYGFRNIQNLVQKIKMGKCAYDYVEVMACPSGCANGGGQIRGATSEQRSGILESVNRLYDALPVNPQMEMTMQTVSDQWQQLNEGCTSLLFTDYHVVDKTVLDVQNLRW